MKAIVNVGKDPSRNLEITLLSEGANDRTLMRLLEQQYPMIVTVSAEQLSVPIASPRLHELPWDSFMKLNSEVPIPPNTTFQVTSDPWCSETLRSVVLEISDPDDWEISTIVVNGRKTKLNQPFDLHPGSVVQLHGRLRSGKEKIFQAHLPSLTLTRLSDPPRPPR